jgi:hypothetical protein
MEYRSAMCRKQLKEKKMTTIKRMTLGALVMLAILVPLSAHAEEGGSGHYMPGATASFIDALPGKPGLAIANFFNYYDGSASGTKQMPRGGLIAGNLDATSYADTVVVLYQTPLKLLGGDYAVGLAIPYIWLEVKGDVRITGPAGTITRSKTDRENGIGDITLYPFMISWTALNRDLKYDVRLGIYAPTGDYDKGNLANVGKNYWTFEPTASISYISSKIGLEVSAFAGLDFNTENEDTNYHSGTQLHLDVTVAEHLPLFGGTIGVGANFFYYQQLEGDSGSGARLGDFKGRTIGIGPVLSYVTKVWQHDLVAELKWLPEIDVGNRLEGDSIWFKLAMAF